MLRVLILAHDYPPLNTIGARRPASWFKHMHKYGIHSVVVTKSWEASSGTVEEIASQKGSDKTVIKECAEGTLIRVPLIKKRPDKLLVRYGASRFILLRKALTFLNLIFAYPFSLFDKNEMMFDAALDYLKKNKVDFIIATAEPFILFKHAYLLSKRFSVPWVADFRDGWSLNHVTSEKKGIAIRTLRAWEFLFEKKYLTSCSFIITVDPLLAGKLAKLHQKRAEVIYNGFEEFYSSHLQQESTALPLKLCHAGTLYPGHQVEVLLNAVFDLHQEGKISPGDLKLQFIGLNFFSEQVSRIMNIHPSIQIYFETTKRLPHEQARKVMSEADFLVVFTEREHPVIPAKTYEYFSIRRPIMVILDDHSILSNLINKSQAGISFTSITHLKEFLLQKIAAKKNNQSLFELTTDEDCVRSYRREIQASKLSALLHSAFSKAKDQN